MILSAQHIQKKFNDKVVLNDVSLSIEPQEKIALIGVNGTGKSTLLKIIAGAETSTGEVMKSRECKVHYLSQNPTFEKETVWEEIQHQNNKNKYPVEEYELKSILTKLGIQDMQQKIVSMSGGQQKRLSLAIALMTKCDVLLLDEPTNHLDNDMIAWLENTLIRTKSAVLMVTHDRYFLDRVCTKIFELNQGDLYVHKGNYQVYLENKEARAQIEEQNKAAYKSLYKKELAWVRAGVQARGTKSKSRLDRFEELRQTRFKNQEQQLELVAPASRLGKKTIEWSQLSFGYTEDNILFKDFSYTLLRHDRIGIIGENGCGKSTFLRVLAGQLQPIYGTIEYGTTVKIGYFQQGDQNVDLSMRVIDYIEEVASVIEYKKQTITAAQMLERFLFPRSMHYTTLDRLSGGERRRLYLLRVLMAMPNVLLLDEPTNDLDIMTLDVLEDYLDDFPGIIIAVSHDRYFLDRVCDSVFVMQDDHRFKQYMGGYSDYVLNREVRKKEDKKENKEYRKPRKITLSYMEKKELEVLPDEMETLETEVAQLNDAMMTCVDFEKINEYSRLRDEKEALLEEKTMRWMELEEKKEG